MITSQSKSNHHHTRVMTTVENMVFDTLESGLNFKEMRLLLTQDTYTDEKSRQELLAYLKETIESEPYYAECSTYTIFEEDGSHFLHFTFNTKCFRDFANGLIPSSFTGLTDLSYENLKDRLYRHFEHALYNVLERGLSFSEQQYAANIAVPKGDMEKYLKIAEKQAKQACEDAGNPLTPFLLPEENDAMIYCFFLSAVNENSINDRGLTLV